MWGIRSRYGAIHMEDTVSSVSFQQCLYYNVQLALVYGVIVALNIYNKKVTYRYRSSLNSSLVLPIYIFWAIAELSRLYFGYVGNLMEKVSSSTAAAAAAAAAAETLSDRLTPCSLFPLRDTTGARNQRVPAGDVLPVPAGHLLPVFLPGACLPLRRHRGHHHAPPAGRRVRHRLHGLEQAHRQANRPVLPPLPRGGVRTSATPRPLQESFIKNQIVVALARLATASASLPLARAHFFNIEYI